MGGGGGGGGGVPAFSPLGEPLTANDVQHKYMCVSSENYLSRLTRSIQRLSTC